MEVCGDQESSDTDYDDDAMSTTLSSTTSSLSSTLSRSDSMISRICSQLHQVRLFQQKTSEKNPDSTCDQPRFKLQPAKPTIAPKVVPRFAT